MKKEPTVKKTKRRRSGGRRNGSLVVKRKHYMGLLSASHMLSMILDVVNMRGQVDGRDVRDIGKIVARGANSHRKGVPRSLTVTMEG